MSITNLEFDKIRPFFDEEVNPAIMRMIKHPYLHTALDYLFNADEKKNVLSNLKKAQSSLDFQLALMYPAFQRIIDHSSDGLNIENSEVFETNGPSVFISNHRDILLDSAILQYALVNRGLETSEITFGSNLMINDFIIDFGKTNRMFTVFREGSSREMLLNSKRLSAYMHHTITEKKRSSWIAQKKGRTKNGFDKTDTTVLKMLTIYQRKCPVEAFLELNLVPVVLSYEYEPCDLLKVREQYLSRDAVYQKQEGEDLKSIITGITQKKGRINLAIGNPVNEFINRNMDSLSTADVHERVAGFIDEEIYKNYKLYSNNYWAYDRLSQSNDLADKYDAQTQEVMLERLEQLYQLMGTKNDELQRMFLELYANPYIQKQSLL